MSDLITIADAASRCGVSTKSIRRRIADGSLKAVRIGPRLIRISVADLEAFGRSLTVAKAGR